MMGAPLKSGPLRYMSALNSYETVEMTLYLNGFTCAQKNKDLIAVSLSPLTIVSNCASPQESKQGYFKVFSVSLLDRKPMIFAAASHSEEEAEDARASWVLSLMNCVQVGAQSLFPKGTRITVDPVGDDADRLLAGYLLHYERVENRDGCYHLLYADVSFKENGAILTLYEDDSCKAKVIEIPIDALSYIDDIVGVQCASFVFQNTHFICRTAWEKKLWFRIISNIRIKLLGRVSDYRASLPHFREEIRRQMELQSFSMDMVPRPLALAPILPAFADNDAAESDVRHSTSKKSDHVGTSILSEILKAKRMANADDIGSLQHPNVETSAADVHLDISDEKQGDANEEATHREAYTALRVRIEDPEDGDALSKLPELRKPEVTETRSSSPWKRWWGKKQKSKADDQGARTVRTARQSSMWKGWWNLRKTVADGERLEKGRRTDKQKK